MPSKSEPMPTWSMPASRRACSTWSATSASVAGGSGFAVRQASSAAFAASGSPEWRALKRASAASSSAHHARTASERKPGTKVTITTPPFCGSRRRTSSGTLRGWASSARAEEWEKTTGAAAASSASCIVSAETCERSTSMPRRFISRTTSSPKGESPPCFGASVAESAQAVFLEWVIVM